MEAKTSENPVLIFGNGEDEAKYANSLVFGEDLGNGTSGPNGSGKTESNEIFDFLSISIKDEDYFYDGCCKNEYQYTGLYLTGSNQWGWIYSSQNLSHRIGRFTENECNGVDRSINEELFHAGTHSPSPSNTLRVFMNTYERDWYCSAKDLGSTSITGQIVYLMGKRKYASEWYADAGGILFTGSVLPVGTIDVWENNKTKIQVIRNN